jgi:type II secretory pathway component PulF
MSESPNVMGLRLEIPNLMPHARRRNQVFRWMAGMMKRGYPLPDILHSLADTTYSFHYPLRRMAMKVEEGVSLGDALSEEWRYCPRIVIELVKLGERRGILPQTMSLACELIDPPQPGGHKSSIKAILAYLAIITVVFLCLAAVMLIFVVPVFMAIFRDANIALPAFTNKVLLLSSLLVNNFFLLLLLCIPALIGLWFGLFKLQGAAFLEKVPLLGRLIGAGRWWRLAYGTGVLMREGVPLDMALATLARGLKYRAVEAAAARLGAHLKEGKTPAEAASAEPALVPMFRWAVSSGQAAGNLPATLIRLGEMERELEVALVSRLAPMLEVFFLIFLITVVGMFSVAMYQPIFVLGGGVM